MNTPTLRPPVPPPAAGERDARFDNAKGFLIVLVVLGHLLQKAPEMSNWRGNGRMAAIYCVIYMFHMPAFAFFSGYFSSAKKSVMDHVRETLLIYFICQTLWCIYLFALSFAGSPAPKVGEIFYAIPGSGLWYLLSLFFWRVVTPVLANIRAPLRAVFILAAYGAVLGLVENIAGEFSLSRTITFFPFFAAGFWARRDRWSIVNAAYSRADVLILCLLALLAPLVFTRAYHVSVDLLTLASPYSEVNLPFPGILFRTMLYLAAFAAIRWICILIPAKRSLLTKLGENSLSIFIGHFYLITPFLLFLPDAAWLRHMIWLAPSLTAICCLVFCHVPVGVYLKRSETWIGEATFSSDRKLPKESDVAAPTNHQAGG